MATKKKPAKKPAKRLAKSAKPVWQKLYLKPGAVLLHEPPKGYTAWLAGSGGVALAVDDVVLQHGATAEVENVWLFVKDVAAVAAAMASAQAHIGASTNLIVSYKKGDQSLHRDTLWAAMEPFGFEGMSLVAVDDTWSAMRFRPKR